MKLAIAQFNACVGDLTGNAERLIEWAHTASAAGASLLLTPELALCGYPPEDLLLRPAFLVRCEQTLHTLAQALPPSMTAIIGVPHVDGGMLYNAAAIIRENRVVAWYHKQKLPNYTVFDEERYFVAGDMPLVFEHQGRRLGVGICADIWFGGAFAQAHAAGAECMLVLNASPFHLNKQTERYQALRERQTEAALPCVYANLVGGQDELVFDGGSFVLDANGVLVQQCPLFEEGLFYVDWSDAVPQAGDLATIPSQEAATYAALVLGTRDYIQKNGFPGVLLGLSGGIDSALVLAIAVEALGAARVRAVMMPSPYTASMSIEDARQLAKNFGVAYDELDIRPSVAAYTETLAPLFIGRNSDTTEENLQARTRGVLLMALSNKTGALVLTTSNKSESAVGYATLYGDMAGGFAVLKDVPKTLVYRLARYCNRERELIPMRVITRAPSAELRPNQTDQDNLPPYEALDAIIERYVEWNWSVAEIIADGFAPEAVQKVCRLIKLSEYKRRQAAVGVRITPRGFGRDWRYPITSKFLQ